MTDQPSLSDLASMSLGPGINKTLNHLGESPEAWRGAITILDSLMELMAQIIEQAEDIGNEVGSTEEQKMQCVGTITVSTIALMAYDERVDQMRDLLEARGAFK